MSALDDKLKLHSGGCGVSMGSPFCTCLSGKAKAELDELRNAADDHAAEVARLTAEREWWKLLFIAAKHTHTATRHLELRCTDSTSDGTLWHVVEVNHKRKTETPRMVMDADGRGQPPKHRPEYVEALGRIVDTFRDTTLAPAALHMRCAAGTPFRTSSRTKRRRRRGLGLRKRSAR